MPCAFAKMQSHSSKGSLVFLDMPAGMHKTQIAFEIMNAEDRSFIMAEVI